MNFKTGLLAICLAALAGSFGAGCGSPCDDLDAICGTCPDAFTTAACNSVVAFDDSDLCDQAISTYDAACNN